MPEECCSPLVVLHCILMLPAIQFNNQCSFNANKIRYIWANWMLATKAAVFKLLSSQHLPQLSFSESHIAAK